jgi:hypothetical protein
VEDEAATPIDTKALFSSWHDPYDAQSLLAELEVRDLVEVNSERQLVVSTLGHEAFAYLDQ